METTRHLTMEELLAGEGEIRRSPADCGELKLIVRRPEIDAREVLEEAELTPEEGLAGDTWRRRGSTATPDGTAHPDMQIAIINTRLVALLAPEPAAWPLAGDQLFVDMDLSAESLPPGTRLAIGDAVLEITAKPHTGCKKFAARFGIDALEFISAPERKTMRLRGIYARVVRAGTIRQGDAVRRV